MNTGARDEELEFEVVFGTVQHVEAEIVKAMLESEGIPVLLTHGGAPLGYAGVFSSYDISVPKAFVGRARKIILEADPGEAVDEEDGHGGGTLGSEDDE